MSDLENGGESLLSDDNNNINLHFMEDIENSYKIYINQLIDIIANILDKLTIKNSLEEDDSNEDENGEIILLYRVYIIIIHFIRFSLNKKTKIEIFQSSIFH